MKVEGGGSTKRCQDVSPGVLFIARFQDSMQFGMRLSMSINGDTVNPAIFIRLDKTGKQMSAVTYAEHDVDRLRVVPIPKAYLVLPPLPDAIDASADQLKVCDIVCGAEPSLVVSTNAVLQLAGLTTGKVTSLEPAAKYLLYKRWTVLVPGEEGTESRELMRHPTP